MLAIAGIAHAAGPRFPELTGRVVDQADILSPQTKDQIDALSAEHERSTGQQIVVVTVKSLQGYPIEQFGYQLGRYWGIGEKRLNNGAILLVAPNERKVRIEVGYGLEGTLTDAQSRVIIEQSILPAFRRSDFNGGILNGTQAILRVLGGNPVSSEPSAHPAGYQSPPWQGVLPLAIWSLLFFGGWGVFIVSWLRHRKDPKYRAINRRNSPFGSGAGWPGGGWSGGGSGGGFSGGGGSFGGGGASGSW